MKYSMQKDFPEEKNIPLFEQPGYGKGYLPPN